jgi:hypothetical protein
MTSARCWHSRAYRCRLPMLFSAIISSSIVIIAMSIMMRLWATDSRLPLKNPSSPVASSDADTVAELPAHSRIWYDDYLSTSSIANWARSIRRRGMFKHKRKSLRLCSKTGPAFNGSKSRLQRERPLITENIRRNISITLGPWTFTPMIPADALQWLLSKNRPFKFWDTSGVRMRAVRRDGSGDGRRRPSRFFGYRVKAEPSSGRESHLLQSSSFSRRTFSPTSWFNRRNTVRYG